MTTINNWQFIVKKTSTLPMIFNKVITSICLTVLAITSLTACHRSTPSADADKNASSVASTTASTASATLATASNSAATNHITLYTSIDKNALAPLLNDFQKQKAITVNVVNDEPMSILARLKAEGSNSPADIILTDDAGVFHQASDAGLLQAFSSDAAIANVPPMYRDPNGNWLALSSYARTAVFDSRVMSKNDISSYGDFARPKWLQKLCISQASFIPNQSLVVNLIDNLGDGKSQEVLKGWIANLSIPPVVDDNAVMQAIDNGQCQVGLVNSNAYANYLQKHPQSSLQLAWLNKGYGGVNTNVTAVAIPKFAKNPQLSLSLIEWLSTKDNQTLFASLSNTYPINKNAQTSVLLKSWDDFEASPIAMTEYAEKQKIALDTMKDVGWR